MHYAIGISCKVMFCSPAAQAGSCHVLQRQSAPPSSPSPSSLLPSPSLVCCAGSRHLPKRQPQYANVPGRCFPPRQAPCPATLPDKLIHSSPRQGKRESRGKQLVFPATQGSVVQALPSFLSHPMASDLLLQVTGKTLCSTHGHIRL